MKSPFAVKKTNKLTNKKNIFVAFQVLFNPPKKQLFLIIRTGGIKGLYKKSPFDVTKMDKKVFIMAYCF